MATLAQLTIAVARPARDHQVGTVQQEKPMDKKEILYNTSAGIGIVATLAVGPAALVLLAPKIFSQGSKAVKLIREKFSKKDSAEARLELGPMPRPNYDTFTAQPGS